MTIGEILNWIRNYRINTHAIASLVLSLPVLYTQNAQLHDAVNAVWLHVPNGLRGLVMAAVPLWMLYRKAEKSGVPIDANVTVAAAEQARKAGTRYDDFKR